MGTAHNPRPVLRLFGPLRLLRTDGTEVAQRSAKGRGLLALLGVAPGLRRPRSWLQDKLWSDRQQEQGAASLRQMLTALRHALEGEHDRLLTDGGWVGLDPASVAVVLEAGDEDYDATGDPPSSAKGSMSPTASSKTGSAISGRLGASGWRIGRTLERSRPRAGNCSSAHPETDRRAAGVRGTGGARSDRPDRERNRLSGGGVRRCGSLRLCATICGTRRAPAPRCGR